MKTISKIFKALLGGVLIISFVFILVDNAYAQSCVLPPDDLVSWWPGEGNANDIADANNGTLQGGATFATGRVGQAFSFDGNGDFVQVPDSANLDITDKITLDAWIKTSGTNDFSGIVGKIGSIDPDTRKGYLLGVNALSKLRCDMVLDRSSAPCCIQGQGTAVSTTSVEGGNWHHVACTYDGAEVKVYVDGVLEATVAYTNGIGLNNEPLRIGRDPFSAPNRDFNGLIDEVEVFNRALTDDEIEAIFEADSAGKCVVKVGKDYRFTDVCFEKDNDGDGEFSEDPVDTIDNDGDGLIDEDPVDCPAGTDLGTQLPNDDPDLTDLVPGNFIVQAVKKKNGTVTSYNPGQYYAVSTITPLTNLDTLWIFERYGECTEGDSPLSALNPKMGTGGGNVVIVAVGPDGVAKQIADSNTLGYSTDLGFGMDTTVSVEVTDSVDEDLAPDPDGNGVPDNAEAHLTNVPADHIILMYVKFGPGLKGQAVPEPPDDTCINENEAQAEFDTVTQTTAASATLKVQP